MLLSHASRENYKEPIGGAVPLHPLHFEKIVLPSRSVTENLVKVLPVLALW